MADRAASVTHWTGGLEFRTDFPGGEHVTLTSGGDHPRSGPSPVAVLQAALAACSGIDVVEILKKMRQPLDELRIEVAAERREAQPRIYTKLHLIYHVTGPELDPSHVVRAVELSQDKYCSVAAMLRPEAALSWEVRVNERPAGRSAAGPSAAIEPAS
jgi:putative redox protein